MKFEAPRIRNFVAAGHSGTGKTSLCDLMLFKAKAVDRLGSVDSKTSVSDYTPDEQEKRSSIYAAYLTCAWRDQQFFFTDTPGYGEFVGEVISAFRASDAALIVLDGVQGIEFGTTRAWKFANDFKIPRFFFVNRLDREMADFFQVLEQLQEAYGKTVCIPLTIPVGKENSLSGVINILTEKNPPAEYKEMVEKYHTQLMDTAVESDEKLMERYLEGETLTEEEIARGLHDAIKAGSLVPVFAGSVAKDAGVEELMNGIFNLCQTPLERIRYSADGTEIKPSVDGDAAAFVFKSITDPFIGQMAFFRVLTGSFKSNSDVINLTSGSRERIGQLMILNGKNQIPIDEAVPGCICAVAKLKTTKTGDTIATSANCKAMNPMDFPNAVMAYAISAVKSGEEDKIMTGLHKLCENDPTLRVERDKETHQTLLKGMGDQHINNAVKRLKDLAKVEVNLSTPKIPYRETVTSHGEGHYRHKKQSGGHGQFAEVYLKVDPNEAGYEFVNAVVGGSIPKNFIPAVEKGVLEAMERGPLAGCLVEKMKITVYDGKFHDVDSSEMAFKIAARMAFRDAMAKAKPVLMEPIITARIMFPDTFTGDISGCLNHKRGRILGMEMDEGLQVITAEVPHAEMLKFATELRSITQGRGSFEMEFARYEVVTPMVANEIIAKFQAQNKEEEDL
ncbi:MAG: Elongation factor G [Lentisphaerae bacterium ADurb.Bin242]|nr:MAG: Elongation factor G [Lentisphaerae bacterium ADurb.Bin242]